ncbi:VV20781 family protein [Vibrio methylphosphonaticus]|uniref:hypothetical protein n=1 Tax=Vibrio methylphosphonaticus TaxID=2946866 RepID=UPI00202ABD4E|nr:hypothetical protein [Vibrio methylphosphonaticus]MCL9776374.1 hypothetical protein [Vibrio methylphosphonaticus]
MKKSICALVISSALFGCGSTVNMKKSDAISTQPELTLKTDGTFWGFGPEGSFDIAGLYHGKYSRSASTSSWFNTINSKEGDMVAEVTRTDGGETWTLICSGGGTSVDIGSFSFGGNGPYLCQISEAGQAVGEYEVARKSEAISLSTAKKEIGFIRLGCTHFNVESIHDGEGLLMSVDNPLGYRFSRGSQEIAAAQTNGAITLQTLANLPDADMNTLALGTVASALSWRPQE